MGERARARLACLVCGWCAHMLGGCEQERTGENVSDAALISRGKVLSVNTRTRFRVEAKSCAIAVACFTEGSLWGGAPSSSSSSSSSASERSSQWGQISACSVYPGARPCASDLAAEKKRGKASDKAHGTVAVPPGLSGSSGVRAPTPPTPRRHTTRTACARFVSAPVKQENQT